MRGSGRRDHPPHPPRRPAVGHVRRLALPRGGRRRGPGGVRAQQPAGRAGPADHRADAAGLGLFTVTGASKAVGLGLGAAPAVILGAVAGVGGGMLRDVLVGQIPSVLRRGLAAISARTAAAITVTAVSAGSYGLPAAAGAVLACFLIAVLGVRYDLNAPMAPGTGTTHPPEPENQSRGPGRSSPGLPGLGGHPGPDPDHRAVRDGGQPCGPVRRGPGARAGR